MKRKVMITLLTVSMICLSACGKADDVEPVVSDTIVTTDQQEVEEENIVAEVENVIEEEPEQGVAEADTVADATEQESSSKKSDLAQEYLNSITIDNAEAKGICGNDLMWFYKDNVLVIRGTGDMTDSTICPEELRNDIHWVIFEEGCTSIGRVAFTRFLCLSKVVFPDSLQSIEEKAFSGCKSLTEVEFPDSLQVIDQWAFENCESLNKVEFSNSLQSIGDCAFQNCTSLTEIVLPDSIQSIGSSVFFHCVSLSEEVIQGLESFGFVGF